MYNNFQKLYKFHVDYIDENGNDGGFIIRFLLHPDSNIAFVTGACIIVNDLPIGSTIKTVTIVDVN